MTVHAAKRPAPTRRAWVYTDVQGERTITVIGEKLVPALDDPLSWDVLDAADAVFFVAGADGVLERARAARVLGATTRSLPPGPGRRAGRRDRLEQRRLGGVRARRPPAGARRCRCGPTAPPAGAGGRRTGARAPTTPAPLPGPLADAYGAGDSFAAGTTFALGRGDSIEDALALGARCGAEAMTRHGPYE